MDIHFRHNQVEKNNIRLFIFDDLTHLFTIFRLSDQIHVFFHPDHTIQKIQNFLVIISNGYFQMFHLLLSFF